MSATSDFLEKVFKTQRMTEWQKWHNEQWAKFSEWAGSGLENSGKLNADQRKWLKFLERTGAGAATDPLVRRPDPTKGFLQVKDLPDASELKESDWRKLYLTCQSTFVRLKANKASYDGVVQDFITDNGYLFDDVTDESLEATADTEAAILSFLAQLQTVDQHDLDILFDGLKKREILELHAAATKKHYNTKKEVRERIQELVRKVVPLERNANKADLERVGFNTAFIRANRLENIVDDYYGWKAPSVSATKLDEFKANYPYFFGQLAKEGNDKILEAYKACEPEDKVVSASIEKAKTDIDYDNPESKNFVPKKLDEELTLVEQIQKWAGDTYEDYFKKYKELRGARIYQHESEVHAILKQIDKAEIKTTDPLSKLASNADAITQKLGKTHPEARNAFEWFGKVLKDFDADPDMSKVMKKALKSGSKMNDLVAELIMRAAEDGKTETVKYAEIAMEILVTIRYGNTTSQIMDAIKEDKTLFDIFGNEKLSWNKNEGMRFVTRAMDKSIRAACMGLGRGSALIVNRFRRHGSRFNRRFKNQKMRQAHEDWLAKRHSDLLAARGARGSDLAAAPVGGAIDIRSEYKRSLDDNTAKRDNAIRGLRRMVGAGPADDDEYIEAQQERLDTTGKLEEQRAYDKTRPYSSLLDILKTAKELRHKIDEYEAARGGGPKEPQQVDLENELANIGVIDLSIVPGQPAAYDVGVATEADIDVRIGAIRGDRRYNIYKALYERAFSRNYEKQQHIDDYRKATQEIELAQERIDKRKEKLEKLEKDDVDGQAFDIYKHLMSYWDTLQDSKLTRFGPRRASRIQEQNNDLVANLFQNNLRGYTFR